MELLSSEIRRTSENGNVLLYNEMILLFERIKSFIEFGNPVGTVVKKLSVA